MCSRIARVLVVALFAGILTPAIARAESWRFEEDETERIPHGWKVEATRQDGPLATWEVAEDGSTPDGDKVLALTRLNHDSSGTFNLCWTDGTSFQDGVITLRMKANSGRIDQGGGPIWRARDKNNYYVCRANPLENNFRLYYVKNGSRKQLASANVKIPGGMWLEIKVEHRGNHIECSLNGAKLLSFDDDTFPEAGGVGLWTKADAATSFDDVTVN